MSKRVKKRKPPRPSVDTVRRHQVKFNLSEEEYQSFKKIVGKLKMTQQKYLVKCVRKAPIYDLTEVQAILPKLIESRSLLMAINRTTESDDVKHAMAIVEETWGELNRILKKNNCTK